MVKNLKLGKSIISLLLAGALTIGGVRVGLSLHRKSEVARVKGYIEDFMTPEGYVDLTRVSTQYDIKSFDGEILQEVLEDMDVSHVRLTDSYVFNGNYVDGFPQKIAFDYDVLLGYDNDGKPVYKAYEPVRMATDEGVEYKYPEGYTLTQVEVLKDPIPYFQLEDKEIHVGKYHEDSYTITLNKK